MYQRANRPRTLNTHTQKNKKTKFNSVNKSWFDVIIYIGRSKLFVMDSINELPKSGSLGNKPLQSRQLYQKGWLCINIHAYILN